MKLEAFVAPGEASSDALIDWLESMEIRARVHDVSKDESALAEAISLGGTQLPVLRHPGGVIVGFDPDALSQIARSGEDVGSGVTIELDDEGRPLVTAVAAGSAGEAAGLKPGDVITELAGYTLFSVEQLRHVLSDSTRRRLPLRIRRGPKLLSLTVQPSRSTASSPT